MRLDVFVRFIADEHVCTADAVLNSIALLRTDVQKGTVQIMAARDDIKTAEANVIKAVADVIAFLKAAATTVTGGLTEDEGNEAAATFNAQAAALEAAIAVIPPAAGGPPAA